MIFGVDVSEWQGKLANTQIDWGAVSQNVQFGVYRVGNGHRYDFDLAHNREGARLCSVSGSYWYFERPGDLVGGITVPSWPEQIAMWQEGAQFQIGEIAQADIEGSLNGNDQVWLLDACNAMADYMGGTDKLFIYSNQNFATNVLTDSAWKNFPLWAAWPNGSPGKFPVPFGRFPDVLIHQYGYTNVPGIVGNVDADATSLSVDDLKQHGMKGAFKKVMADYRHNSAGAVYEITQGHKAALTGDYFYGVIMGQLNGSGVTSPLGIYSYQVDDAKLAAIPDLPFGGGTVVSAPTKFAITGEAVANG